MKCLETRGVSFDATLDEIKRLAKPVGVIVVGLDTKLRSRVLAKINRAKLGTGAFIVFRNDDAISDSVRQCVAAVLAQKENVVAVAEGDAVLSTDAQRRLITWMHELGASNVIRIVVRCDDIKGMTPHEMELNAWLWNWPSDPLGCNEEKLLLVSD